MIVAAVLKSVDAEGDFKHMEQHADDCI